MSYEPLHHKYRPQTFGDLIGQETIALTLTNALKQVKIAPAYLFTGPRGTGKTSSARILAKSLNCLVSDRPTPYPCGKCEACLAIAKGSALDVMEIDAASNTGVDNIREIIERARFAPVQCRYKIYAIDECHMLSTAAFNALLKTLEEPPPQVVFILATTDPQRVLSTIISRCQRFDYRRIPLESMTAHLKYIAQTEQIAIADDALTLIAQIANGGLRDAESLLDQLSLLPETITVERVWDLVGAVPERDLFQLLQAINRNDSLAVLQQCRNLLDRGREPLVILQNLAGFYLNLLIAKTAPQRSSLTAVTETCWQQLCNEATNWDTSTILRGQQQLKDAEAQLKHTTQPRLWLEVALLGLLPQANTVSGSEVAAPSLTPHAKTQSSLVTSRKTATADVPPQTAVERSPAKPISAPDRHRKQTEHSSPDRAKPPTPAIDNATPVSPFEVVNEPNARSQQNSVDNREIWSKVVSCLQPPTTQALLKQQCHLVSFDGSSAIVGISSAKLQKLHQGKVPNIEAAFERVCQRKVKVQLEADDGGSLAKTALATNAPQPQSDRGRVPDRVPASVLTSSATVVPTEEESFSPSTTTRFGTHDEPVVPLSSITPKQKKEQFNGIAPKISVPSTLPENNLKISTTPKAIEPELDPDRDDADDNLQEAIDNLTLSFEGELVQLDNLQVDSAPSPMLEQSEPSSLDRPDVEDYDDDW